MGYEVEIPESAHEAVKTAITVLYSTPNLNASAAYRLAEWFQKLPGVFADGPIIYTHPDDFGYGVWLKLKGGLLTDAMARTAAERYFCGIEQLVSDSCDLQEYLVRNSPTEPEGLTHD